MFGPKYIERHQRREALKKIFDAQVLDFHEDNTATLVLTFFEDVLAALPESAKQCEVELLFKAAYGDWKS